MSALDPIYGGTVSIALNDGTTVKVSSPVIYGPWAVTKRLDEYGLPSLDFWTVTHIPSGLKITRRYGIREREVAERLARRVAEVFGSPEWFSREILDDLEAGRRFRAFVEAWIAEAGPFEILPR